MQEVLNKKSGCKSASEKILLIFSGEKVGEDDILEDKRRTATLTTQSEEVQLLSIHKDFYREIITRENENGVGIETIASSSFILSKWPIEELSKNPTQWIIRNYKADSWISEDLWNDDWVFVVKSGFCVVAKVRKPF